MKNLLKSIIVCVVASMILNIASVCYAQNMGRKLCRGVANIATGWIEIPKNMYDTSIKENIVTGLTLGAVKGAAMTFVRTGFGIYDTLTFLLPIPEGYNPLLEPEFVFGSK